MRNSFPMINISPKMGEVSDTIGLAGEWNQLCKCVIVKRHTKSVLKSITHRRTFENSYPSVPVNDILERVCI